MPDVWNVTQILLPAVRPCAKKTNGAIGMGHVDFVQLCHFNQTEPRCHHHTCTMSGQNPMSDCHGCNRGCNQQIRLIACSIEPTNLERRLYIIYLIKHSCLDFSINGKWWCEHFLDKNTTDNSEKITGKIWAISPSVDWQNLGIIIEVHNYY